jgi:hypothetical protein
MKGRSSQYKQVGVDDFIVADPEIFGGESVFQATRVRSPFGRRSQFAQLRNRGGEDTRRRWRL